MSMVRGEARYGLELFRLLANTDLWRQRRLSDPPPVLLIPGFMAGDASLLTLRAWLRRRGHRVWMSGIRANVNCAEREVTRLQARLRTQVSDTARMFVIGQSRGGAIARVLAAREPELVCGLVTLGTPVLDPLAVSAPVLGAVRAVARLGDAGVPGLFSTECADGSCCAAFRPDLIAPLDPGMRAVAIHSRTDGIVDWRACLDPHAERIEVNSSHVGMAVNPEVYRLLERVVLAT